MGGDADVHAPSAYVALLERITNGDLRPGEKLREAALADELGMSRTPVREALRALAAEGLVEIVRNRGAQVRNWTSAQIDDTYSLRAELEGFAARRAAVRAQPDDVADLIRIQEELEHAASAKKEGWLDAVADANVRFHTRILEISQTPFLDGFVATLHSASFVRRAFRGYSPEDIQRTIGSHRDIIAGIKTANSALSEASMQAHILAAIPAATQVFRGDVAPPA